MKKPTVLIRNWQFVYNGTRLFGDVVKHPLLGDANCVTTSRIVAKNESLGTVETVNTIYKLEERAD